MGYFWGSKKGSKTLLGSTHVVTQLLFHVVPSILTFNFDLILWSFFTFWALMGYFWAHTLGLKQIVLGATHVVEQLSLSVLPSILTFDFDLILAFWGPNGLFLGSG